MANLAYNLVLYNKRKEMKLSRREASKALHISSLSLFLYEKGYYIIPEKRQQRFIEFYHLPEDFFTNELLYPSPLDKEKKKKRSTNNNIPAVFTHKATKIVLFVILGGLLALIPAGYIGLSKATSDIKNYYSERFLEIRNQTILHGKKSTDAYTGFVGYTYNMHVDEKAGSIDLNYFFYQNESKIKDWIVDASIKNTESTVAHEIKMKTAILYNGVQVSVHIIDPSSQNYYFDFLHNASEYKLTSAYDSEGNKVDPDKFDEFEKTARACLTLFNVCYDVWNQEILGSIYVEGYDFDHFCEDGINGYDSYKYNFAMATKVFIIASVAAAIVGFLIFGSFYLSSKKEKDLENKSLIDSTSVGNNSPPSNVDHYKTKYSFYRVFFFWKGKNRLSKEEYIEACENKKAQKTDIKLEKKNFFFPHIFFEPVTRTIVVLLIMFSSIAFFLFCVYILKIGMDIMNINRAAIDTAQFLYKIKVFAASLVCIATILHIFIKFDNFISYRNYISSIVAFIFIGLIFYVFEITLIYSAQKGLNNFSEFINLYAAYFPSNMFFGFAAYSLIAMFLFSMPKKFEKSVTRQHIWRTLVIIPIAYLAFSIIYNVGIKAYSWTKFPYFVSLLLYPEALVTTLFVVIYCLGVFIYRKYLSKKYNKEDYEAYTRGTKYILFKNVLAASIVLALGIVELIFKFGVPQSHSIKILKLGNNFLILIAIPILILFRPHFGKRNPAADGAYIVSYGLAYMLGYLLLLIVILPYINVVMPILNGLISYLLG